MSRTPDNDAFRDHMQRVYHLKPQKRLRDALTLVDEALQRWPGQPTAACSRPHRE